MRILAVAILTACQFTVFPFLAIVAAHTARNDQNELQMVLQADSPNVTTIYKTVQM